MAPLEIAEPLVAAPKRQKKEKKNENRSNNDSLLDLINQLQSGKDEVAVNASAKIVKHFHHGSTEVSAC